jgi:hypothetical protein
VWLGTCEDAHFMQPHTHVTAEYLTEHALAKVSLLRDLCRDVYLNFLRKGPV